MTVGDSTRTGEAMTEVAAGVPRGRPASTDSDYITGQVIMADGGMVLV